jgi:uncharacterized membrane protein
VTSGFDVQEGAAGRETNKDHADGHDGHPDPAGYTPEAAAARAESGARRARTRACLERPEPDRGQDHRVRRSMAFVYISIIWFGCWIGFRVEKYPYGLLTMIVSLEAIFLSTFVMISQNRADAKRQVVADLQWTTVQQEDKENQELLELSRQILELTKQVHAYAAAARAGETPPTS